MRNQPVEANHPESATGSVPKKYRCRARRRDGRACGGWRRRGSRLCLWHDPARPRQRRKKRSAAAEETLPGWVSVGEVRYQNPVELRALLARLLVRLEAGGVSPGVAYAAAYLAKMLHEFRLPTLPEKPFDLLTPEEQELRAEWLGRKIRQIYGWPEEEAAPWREQASQMPRKEAASRVEAAQGAGAAASAGAGDEPAKPS
jgi:hypothetical protein